MRLPCSLWWSVHSETYRQPLGHWGKGSTGRRAAHGGMVAVAKGARNSRPPRRLRGSGLVAAGEALWEPGVGGKPHPRVAVTIFSLRRKISQPGSVNSLVGGSELNRPFPAVVSPAPTAQRLLFYPVLPLHLCGRQLCKVAIKELN